MPPEQVASTWNRLFSHPLSLVGEVDYTRFRGFNHGGGEPRPVEFIDEVAGTRSCGFVVGESSVTEYMSGAGFSGLPLLDALREMGSSFVT